MIAFVGKEGVEGKLEPNTRTRGIWVTSFATIVFGLNGPSWQGGHDKIHKVWIENCDWVPSYIEFANEK
jgi:hypothetical protein